MKLKRMATDNWFTPALFDKMCEELESGQGIWLYCWCSGHTRCAMVIGDYTTKLKEKYGDRLTKVKDDDGWTEGYVLAH